jgi:hypothetical protein
MSVVAKASRIHGNVPIGIWKSPAFIDARRIASSRRGYVEFPIKKSAAFITIYRPKDARDFDCVVFERYQWLS